MPPLADLEDKSGKTVGLRNSNLSWQVDISKLVELVGRIGIQGLKKFQQSGVDIHTIGCILALGELTPTCFEFRRDLNRIRIEQRQETWWLHQIVEFGSGSNFFVDELLRTRAGENVLALITAVASTCTDETFAIVLTSIYQKLGTPAHSTPSLSQLQALRTACLPLAKKLSFKDRLLETFEWIRVNFSDEVSWNDSLAIPESQLMAELIITLNNVARDQDNKTKLAYHGIRGLAWVMAYSWIILQLPIIVIQKDGTVHPKYHHSSFNGSLVIFYPGSEGPATTLQQIDKASDVIILRSDESERLPVLNWSVTCGGQNGVDVVKMMCGWNIPQRQELGNLLYSIAYEFVELRILLHTAGYPIKEGNRILSIDATYLGHSMITYSSELEKILQAFGLPPDLTVIENWREKYFKVIEHEGDIYTQKKTVDVVELGIFSRMTKHTSDQHRHCNHPILKPLEMKFAPRFCIRCRLFWTIEELASISSTLAFTDWATHHKKLVDIGLQPSPGQLNLMSLRFEVLMAWNRDADPSNSLSSLHPVVLDSLSLDPAQLVVQLSRICAQTSSRNDHDLMINEGKHIGLNVDGTLLIQYRAIEPNLFFGPIFIIREGEFRLNDERRPALSASFSNLGTTHEIPFKFEAIEPWNLYEKIPGLSVKASLPKDSISLQYRFDSRYLDGGPQLPFGSDVDVKNVLESIHRLYVTSPCDHDAKAAFNVSQVEVSSASFETPRPAWLDGVDELWFIEHTIGSALIEPNDGHGLFVHYFPVMENPMAQWATVANVLRIGHRAQQRSVETMDPEGPSQSGIILRFNNVPGLMVLQRDACLRCTKEQAKRWLNSDHGHILIISATL